MPTDNQAMIDALMGPSAGQSPVFGDPFAAEKFANPAVDSMIRGLGNMVAGPGQIMAPNPYPPGSEEASWYEDQRSKGMQDWSRNAAMTLGAGGVPMAEKGAAGIFGGRLAKTADQNALAEAEALHASGATKDQIWNQTGWFKGTDDKWRFEIPDYNSQMNQAWHENGVPDSNASRIAGQLWHKPLYEAYPDLRQAESLFQKDHSSQGSYYMPEQSSSGVETIKASAPNAPAARSVLLHEAQHAIQEREGFAGGGSPSMFKQGNDAELARTALSYRRELAEVDPHLTPKQKDDIIRKKYEDAGAPDWFPSSDARSVAHTVEDNPTDTLQRVMELYGTDTQTSPFSPLKLYRELPGEVEARNVQARADMTPAELRATPPWMTADTQPRPIMNQIYGQGRDAKLIDMLMNGGGR
jgi:hypothetical protein